MSYKPPLSTWGEKGQDTTWRAHLHDWNPHRQGQVCRDKVKQSHYKCCSGADYRTKTSQLHTLVSPSGRKLKVDNCRNSYIIDWMFLLHSFTLSTITRSGRHPLLLCQVQLGKRSNPAHINVLKPSFSPYDIIKNIRFHFYTRGRIAIKCFFF